MSAWKLIAVLFLVAGLPRRADSQTVYEQNGSIMLASKGLQPRAITTYGYDHDPVLSPDADLVVFCRGMAGADSHEAQLWSVSTRSAATGRALVSAPVPYDGLLLNGCRDPLFSIDGKTVFYLLSFSDTSGVIARLNLDSGEIRAISDAIGFHVVRKGKYRGQIVCAKA